ncbi:MAG: M15 family metallopeptidase [Oscillospiraceae bacterium]
MKIFATLAATLIILTSATLWFGFKKAAPEEEAVAILQESLEVIEEQSFEEKVTIPQESEVPREIQGESTAPLLDYNDWRLILVNPQKEIPEDFTVDLSDFNGYFMDKRIISDCKDMFDAAASDGIPLMIYSAYRTRERSQVLLDREVALQMAAGLSQDEALAEAVKKVAPPGTSEHHTGLALDAASPPDTETSSDISETMYGKWLRENSYLYGFIVRYPKGGESITGIKYEPWHVRYVGKEHAKKIFDGNLCLEEYLEKGE